MGNSAEKVPSPLPDFNLAVEFAKIKEDGINRTRAKSIEFCRLHILKNKNPDACYLLARYYIDLLSYYDGRWDMNIAVPHLIMAVDGGNKDALVYLALFYYLGSYEAHYQRETFSTWKKAEFVRESRDGYMELPQDYKKSFAYFTQAAVHFNNAQIYYYLGLHFEFARGIGKDLLSGLKNYKLSYNLKNGEAVKRICEVWVKIGVESISDDDLKIFLVGKNTIYLGYFHVAKIYETRKNYELTILYCDEQLKNAGLELEDIDHIRKFRRSVENKLGVPTPEVKSKIGILEKEIVDLKNTLDDILQQRTIVKPSIRVDIVDAVPVGVVIPPPPYIVE
ncbi:MAG: hypothetical protein Hyperionvirus1_168 [Hyperionvirus sp.]|uniref:Uncharacterized protein n=1 Tax=Hyperionvirus sp. TaxID=2487770 RepID=A0A3G5ABA4_9VIRU|nr:MAG: hypothetical protein Hyperionvirus1_168 [Hyperionvirus sp.]